jgi:hypothetical protein
MCFVTAVAVDCLDIKLTHKDYSSQHKREVVIVTTVSEVKEPHLLVRILYSTAAVAISLIF